MSNQSLSDVFANVQDAMYGAQGDGSTDDRIAIQAAIDSGRHLLFPEGVYGFTGTLTFGQENQRSLFLSGASLQAIDANANVVISGVNQRMSGLDVVAPVSGAAFTPWSTSTVPPASSWMGSPFRSVRGRWPGMWPCRSRTSRSASSMGEASRGSASRARSVCR